MSGNAQLNRRSVLAVAGFAGLGAVGLAPADAADDPVGDRLSHEQVQAYFAAMKPSKTCGLLPRTIDDTTATAKVVPGIVNDTFFLLVAGKKPVLNMTVTLNPLTYVMQPDFWEVEVVGCTPGIVLPTVGLYAESLSLDLYRGKKGVEVVWADQRERLAVP